MMTYRALKEHPVAVYNGTVIVKKGELVNFAIDPGEGWELVGEVKHGSDKGKPSRTVAGKR